MRTIERRNPAEIKQVVEQGIYIYQGHKIDFFLTYKIIGTHNMMGSICSTDATATTTTNTIKPFTRSWESYIGEQELGRPDVM